MSDAVLRAEVEALREVNDALRERLSALQESFLMYALPGEELARLTPAERAISKMLHDHAGRFVRKDRLYHAVYALRLTDDAPEPKIIDAWICKLRRKLTRYEIVTAWGEGYLMRERVAA